MYMPIYKSKPNTANLHTTCMCVGLQCLIYFISKPLFIHPRHTHHTHIHTTYSMHTHACTYIHAHTHTHARAHTHTDTHTPTYTHTHTQRGKVHNVRLLISGGFEKSQFEQQKAKKRKSSGQLFHFCFERFGDGASWIS